MNKDDLIEREFRAIQALMDRAEAMPIGKLNTMLDDVSAHASRGLVILLQSKAEGRYVEAAE